MTTWSSQNNFCVISRKYLNVFIESSFLEQFIIICIDTQTQTFVHWQYIAHLKQKYNNKKFYYRRKVCSTYSCRDCKKYLCFLRQKKSKSKICSVYFLLRLFNSTEYNNCSQYNKYVPITVLNSNIAIKKNNVRA